MIIGIEAKLEGVKNYLQSLGCYEVHTLDTYEGVYDAIIYTHEAAVAHFDAYQYQAIHNAIENATDISSGTLMIRATHKTPEDIHELLQARCMRE